MLDLARYLLGVAEIALLAGFATLGASALRARLLPDFEGAPAHLAAAVIALALLIWMAEILGSFGVFEAGPYVFGMVLVGLGLWLGVGGRRGGPSRWLGFSPGEDAAVRGSGPGEKQDAAAREGPPRHPPGAQTVAALAVAVVAVIHFAADVKVKLGTGMTGFDSTWYHGPFAAGFFQGGSTWDLHFIAPQFLAWFYPANGEIFHAAGMLAFGRDVLSPLLNLGWFVGCLVACWCIGRPYRVAPWSLALGAVALSLPVLSDQAGEARNDIVGIFFLLAAVAIAVNAVELRRGVGEAADQRNGGNFSTIGPAILVGLAAGLAAGTKLNFLLPAAVLVLGLTFVAPAANRLRVLAAGGLAAVAGGGYWYLRNLIHTGNPLPWFDSLGPVSLPAPDQALGGREGHSVLGYLTDGSVWSDWFLPGLHSGLTILWPLLLGLALASLLLTVVPLQPRLSDRVLVVAGATGLAVIVSWLIAPTSASGPEGLPRGFESGLRYLAPALVLGLALLPVTSPPRHLLTKWQDGTAAGRGGRWAWVAVSGLVLLTVAIGYPVQRQYLKNRYANPTFAAPGLNAAFEWADDISDARIATTSTRQYPLYGTDLSNHVQYIGEEAPHGGFISPSTCKQWRRLLNEGNYDYVVTSRDRVEPGKPPYPPTTRWTEGLGVTPISKTPPTVVFKLNGRLDPLACP